MRERKVGVAVEVDLIFKIAAIGIIVAVLNQLLIRSGREEEKLLEQELKLLEKELHDPGKELDRLQRRKADLEQLCRDYGQYEQNRQ